MLTSFHNGNLYIHQEAKRIQGKMLTSLAQNNIRDARSITGIDHEKHTLSDREIRQM